MEKTKRKGPVITKETAIKICKNPKSPMGIRKFYKKKFDLKVKLK
jgi:hypothetical protein